MRIPNLYSDNRVKMNYRQKNNLGYLNRPWYDMGYYRIYLGNYNRIINLKKIFY